MTDPEQIAPIERLGTDGWAELFNGCHKTAHHLQMRDHYALTEELDAIAAWRRGDYGPEQDAEIKARWLALMRTTANRGVHVRRTRIVSVPVTEFIRFEHEFTPQNLAAGEDIRWLPRTRASTLTLPGNDCWVFDHKTVVFNHFTGDGAWIGNEITQDRDAVELCMEAFGFAWAKATPHAQFHLVPDLLAGSSLDSPQARAVRARAPQDVSLRVLDNLRLDKLREQEAADGRADT